MLALSIGGVHQDMFDAIDLLQLSRPGQVLARPSSSVTVPYFVRPTETEGDPSFWDWRSLLIFGGGLKNQSGLVALASEQQVGRLFQFR